MKAFTKYIWIAATSARSNLAYVGEVASRTVFLGVLLYILVRLWSVVYAEANSKLLGGLELPQMIWYLVITESIVLSGQRIAADVDEDVRTGRLAVQLLRPLSYPLYRLAHTLGERFLRFFMNAATGGLVALILIGPVHVTPAGLAMFAIVLPAALVVDSMAYLLIGLCAFWFESTSGIALIYSRIVMMLGGMMLPIEIFPDAIQPVVRAMPFASILYAPARMFVAPSAPFLMEVILRQFAALALFGLAVAGVQGIAVKRIQANGG
ncbi:MAG TPA: ABC-2 family transporter protein [Terriglobia bacterium]|nr:ABC-2 family transporter protein [Terriglobia bacterium]